MKILVFEIFEKGQAVFSSTFPLIYTKGYRKKLPISRISDPSEIYHDLNPTFEKKQDPDPTSEINPNPDPSLEKKMVIKKHHLGGRGVWPLLK